MDPRMPPQIPFSRNNAASPSFTRSPFAPAPASSASTASVSSPYPPRPAPATSPAPAYAEHHQRRPSDTNPFYASHTQSRPPPPYTTEPTSHPIQAHVRHHSSSSINNATVHRAMPPPSPSQQQQQQPPPHQMGAYGGPSTSRPPVNLGHPGAFPSGRELPALNSLARTTNTGGSMSISSILGGPPPAPREPTPGHAPPYPPPATTSAVSGPAYATSVHASPRMQNAAEYSPFHRRPQTPEPGRPPFDARDHRGTAAGSPHRGIYGTPELSRYSTPQAYSQRPPPMASADDNRREPNARVGTASVPPRPSSQPRSYHGMAPRPPDMGRGPPPPHGDPMYPPREEGRPVVGDYNPERGPPRPMPYEDQHRLAAERERERERETYREHMSREAEFRERERRERERIQFEEQRPAMLERERMERDRERDREIELQRVQRARTTSDPTHPPGQHPEEHRSQPTSRQPLPHYGRPDPRDSHNWPPRPGYDQPPRDVYGQPYAAHRPGEYPAATGPPYGAHPAYAHQPPPERFPPTSQPPHHGAPTSQPPPQQGHPFESPDRHRFAPLHSQHQHQQQRTGPVGVRPAEEGPPPPSVAYNGGPGAAAFEAGRPRPADDSPSHLGPQRGLLGVEINRKGRLSPLPQAVQGAQPMAQGPAGEPGIKSEFGRMFSGIGSGVRGIGVSSPGPSGAQIPFSNPNLRRDDVEPPHQEAASEAPTKTRKKRGKPKDEDGKGDDDSNGRATPVGRTKRAKTHAHHHHHQYGPPPLCRDVPRFTNPVLISHHHHHHHASERAPSPLQGVGGSLKNLKSTTPVPSPTGRDYAFTHHHHQPPRSHPNTTAKPPPPGPIIIPKPKQKVSSQAALDSVSDRPRKHLGDVVYSVTLKPTKLESSHNKFGYSTTPRPLPMDMIKDNENSSLTVKIPRVHLTPSAREEITARRAIWGTDVYTDDSDVVAACIHAGWIRGEWASDVDVDLLELQKPASKSKQRILPVEQHLEVLNSVPASGPIHVPADRDLHVTLLILPPLEKYASSTRYGIQSREFGGTYNGRKSFHDGLSFMILSVRWVDGAAPQSRLRGKARRERIRKAMSEVNRSQVVDIGEKEVFSKATAGEQDATKGGPSRQGNGDGNKENRPVNAVAPVPPTEAPPRAEKAPSGGDKDMGEKTEQVEGDGQKPDEQRVVEPGNTAVNQGQTKPPV